ncbi:hypothetical protein H0H93_006882 [Arthromyces matolae]|nr:hypothetical protein H0H93_006882 [Arthromyces matolae]
MKYSQAIIIATLGTSALVAAVPLPSQNNNAPGSGTASSNADSPNPAPPAVQGTPSLDSTPSDGSSVKKSPPSLQTRDTFPTVSGKPPVNNNQSGTAPTPVASTPSVVNPDSGNATPSRRDIGAIDMGLLTRVIQNELDARGYPDDSAIIARDLANNYDRRPRGLGADLEKVGGDFLNLPATLAANTVRGAQNAIAAAGTATRNFVNNHATISTTATTDSTSGGTGGIASPGATFRRDLELNARDVPGEPVTHANSSLLGKMTQAARVAAADHFSKKLDHAANKIKGHMRATIAPGSQTPSTGYSGEEQGGFDRRAPGQGVGSLSSDLLNKRRNIEEFSVHERDFEDDDIYGRDLEIANLD